MNQQELSKIQQFLTSQHRIAHSHVEQKQEEHYSDEFQRDQSPDKDYGRNNLDLESRIDGFNNLLSDFKDRSPHAKCIKTTKTKWDKFAPYAFNKLQKQQKTDTFLQLFEDYNIMKKKYNDSLENNKKMATKVHFLEAEFAKLKTFNSLSPVDKMKVEKQKNEEVIKLKAEIKKLHEKIIALTGNKFNKFSNRPKTANKPHTQKVIQPVNENLRAELDQQRKHVRQLLIIIDELKKTKIQTQQLLKEKQSVENNFRNQSKVHTSNLKVGGGANIKSQSQFYEFSNELQHWKQKYNDLELIYRQMDEDKEKKIRDLGNQLIDIKQKQRMKQKLQRNSTLLATESPQSEKYQQKIRNLEDQKQNLERELRQLVALPFYQNNKQIIQVQQKLNILQVKYRRAKEDLSKANQASMKYFAELEYKNKENQMLKNQNSKMKKQIKESFEKEQGTKLGLKSSNNEIDYDDYYRKALAMVKLEGEDPVWRKFSVLAKPEFITMTEKQAKQTAEKLWHSKLQLLAHLQKAQIELNTMKANVDSRINIYIKDKEYLEEELRITRARLDEWISMQKINNAGYRDFKVFQQAGIKYDDTISVFDIQQKQLKQLQSNENYFDLYLGHLNIDETALLKNPDNRIKNMNNFISFLTVDFYNHETQHSEFSEGVIKKLANNYSFKVEVDTYFLKYLSKNSIMIQLWSPQGTATIMLGKGQIYLSELITKAHKDISNVLRGKCQIYHKDRMLIASVEYRIRMRLPIGPYLQWAQTKKQFKASLAKDPFAIGKKKNLGITIQRAEGLPAGMNAFVYFTVQNEDFFTEPERGPTPMWDFHRDLQIAFDEQFCDELKQKYFEFTIFDDDKQVNEDVYGIAKVNFTPLTSSTDSLDIKADIVNGNGQKVGKLKLKATLTGVNF